MTEADIQVGDRVRHKYFDFKAGIVVRIDDPSINPYCILVRTGGGTDGMEVECFKPEHLVK